PDRPPRPPAVRRRCRGRASARRLRTRPAPPQQPPGRRRSAGRRGRRSGAGRTACSGGRRGSKVCLAAVRRAILIAGPTASGKSALALALADRLVPHGGAVIVNADSMQVYRDLCILTARPSAAEEARHPHALYGVLDASEASSAMRWRTL